MLTSLDFLNKGQSFPPKSEIERMDMYEKNKLLFEGEHARVYEQDFKRIERVIGNFSEVVSYPIIANFQKLMSLKIADLLLGDPPQVIVGDIDSPQRESYQQIKKNSDLDNTAYQTAIDVSRYGDGLFYIRKTEKGGVIDVTQPPFWFPVVNPDNVKDITHHVIAWEYEEVNNGRKEKFVKAQIHEKGRYTEKKIKVSTSESYAMMPVLGDTIYEEEVQTGLDDFAVVQVSNVMTSDRVTGLDDYSDIDSILSELLVRVAQVSRILDKHASPSMEGPRSALEQEPSTGEWKVKAGNFFIRESTDDPPVDYITWDGQLESNFKQIEILTNLLYTLSEMGSALFGDMSANTGQVPSGSALRRLMVSPLAKVNRIRMRFDAGLKKAIKLCSQLKGDGVMDLSKENISIVWQDGLPNDPVEEAEIMEKRTAGKPTMSQRRALTQYDTMTDDEAEEELGQIQEEERMNSPVLPNPFAVE